MNLFLTMLLGGLWHGAAWTYVLWGAFHGLLLAIERYLNVSICEHLELPYNIIAIMKFKLSTLLCWLGIHRYKIIDASFGFTSKDMIQTVQCKNCGIKKIIKTT